MQSVEEFINIPILIERSREVADRGETALVINEIVRQSRLEFQQDEMDGSG